LIIQTFREPIGNLQAGFCAGSVKAFRPARLKLEVDEFLTTIPAA
jgi:hypothetical protein